MPTVTLYAPGASPVIDARVSRIEPMMTYETWAQITAGAGTDVLTPLLSPPSYQFDVLAAGQPDTNQFTELDRTITGFDLSSIPVGATISAVTLSLASSSSAIVQRTANNPGSINFDVDIVSASPVNAASIVASDYSNVGSTSYGSINTANISQTGSPVYNDIVLNASGIAYVQSKIGSVCCFSVRLGWDVTGTIGTPWSGSQDAASACFYPSQALGGSPDPRLTITYTPPAPAAPVCTTASSVVGTSFSANWQASSGATGYYIDVALDSGFVSMVSGYNNLDVGNVLTKSVTGLTNDTVYYYRVRAYSGGGTSGNSNTITTTTRTFSSTTNTSPIVITTTSPHGLVTGEVVQITGVLGNTNANDYWVVSVIDANNFSLDGSVGSGSGTGGGFGGGGGGGTGNLTYTI